MNPTSGNGQQEMTAPPGLCARPACQGQGTGAPHPGLTRKPEQNRAFITSFGRIYWLLLLTRKRGIKKA